METHTSIARYNFKPMKYGTQFSGWGIAISFDINGTETDVVSDIIGAKMNIRKCFNSKKIEKQLSLGSGLSINTQETPNILVIDAGFTIDIDPAENVYDIAINFATYGKKNFIEGAFPVVNASSVI